MTTIDHLPDEMVMEILSWLPVKSAIVCKCTKKSWKRLIDTSYFARSHFIKAAEKENLVFVPLGEQRSLNVVKDMDSLKSMELPISNFAIKGSSRGLILLVVGPDYQLSLFNPSTRNIQVNLPDFPSMVFNMTGVYDCSIFGLGYDVSSQDHKVVVLHRCRGKSSPYVYRVDVYSVRSGVWVELGVPFKHNAYLGQEQSGVFCNGAMHWVGWESPAVVVLISFNLSHQTFSEISLPFDFKPSQNNRFQFSVLGGLLCLLENQTQFPDLFHIWVMKESWSKLTIVKHHSTQVIKPLYYRSEDHNELVGLSEEMELIALGDGANLEIFKLVESKVEHMLINGIPALCVDAWAFLETLFQPVSDEHLEMM